jgi:hypothetical protein
MLLATFCAAVQEIISNTRHSQPAPQRVAAMLWVESGTSSQGKAPARIEVVLTELAGDEAPRPECGVERELSWHPLTKLLVTEGRGATILRWATEAGIKLWYADGSVGRKIYRVFSDEAT